MNDLCIMVLEASLWIKTGERQASRLRYLYSDIINSIGIDSHLIQEVIAEKVVIFIYFYKAQNSF